MRKWLRVRAAVMCISACSSALIVGGYCRMYDSMASRPYFQGRSVSFWRSEILRFHDDLAICTSPTPEAIPVLLELLEDNDREVRLAALKSIRLLGPRAAPTVPALVRLLSGPDLVVQSFVLKALEAIGPEA